MEYASKIELSLDLGSSQLSIQATNKNAKLLEILALTSEISTFLSKERLTYKIKKRISQQTKGDEEQSGKNDLAIFCHNSQLRWEEAYLSLERKSVIFPTSVSALDIFHVCNTIEQETFVDENIVESQYRQDIIDFILKHFPVMYAKKRKAGVLMNIHDLIMLPDLFVTIDEEQDETEAGNIEVNKTASKLPEYGPHQKRGRKSLHKVYPNLVP